MKRFLVCAAILVCLSWFVPPSRGAAPLKGPEMMLTNPESSSYYGGGACSSSSPACRAQAASLTLGAAAPAASAPGRSDLPSTQSPPAGSLAQSEPAAHPEAVLWNQPLSSVNQNAYVDQEFPDAPSYSSFLADDFTSAGAWAISTIFVPGNGWNGFSSLSNATALHWMIYADCSGVPCGDPSGGGSPAVWTLALPPTDAQVTITNGTGGYPSNTTLNLATPFNLPAGHWWLIFYPTMGFSAGGQFGRQPADTTNGGWGQFINPGNGFGHGTGWQLWSVIGATQHDIAFRLEGGVAGHHVFMPLVVRIWPPLPAAPTLYAIDNSDGDGNYTVSWSTADRAISYTLQEDDNDGFTSPTTAYSGTGTSVAITGKPAGTYYYRVNASNNWGDGPWSNIESATVNPRSWQTIVSTDFEGAFPGSWTVFDAGNYSGQYFWAKRTCRAYAGSHSGWAVGGGANGSGLTCGKNYPNNAESWMIYGPFSLVGASAADLSFQLWLYSELDYDGVAILASINGTNWYGGAVTGNSNGWISVTLDLSNVPTLGNLLGHPQVLVALAFLSNSSVNYPEGAYVDNIVLRKSVGQGAAPGSEAAPALPSSVHEEPISLTLKR